MPIRASPLSRSSCGRNRMRSGRWSRREADPVARHGCGASWTCRQAGRGARPSRRGPFLALMSWTCQRLRLGLRCGRSLVSTPLVTRGGRLPRRPETWLRRGGSRLRAGRWWCMWTLTRRALWSGRTGSWRSIRRRAATRAPKPSSRPGCGRPGGAVRPSSSSPACRRTTRRPLARRRAGSLRSWAQRSSCSDPAPGSQRTTASCVCLLLEAYYAPRHVRAGHRTAGKHWAVIGRPRWNLARCASSRTSPSQGRRSPPGHRGRLR